MKNLFIHNLVFRMISPIISAVIAYLLILMYYNNINQLQEQFLSEELLVCIVIAVFCQESSRAFLHHYMVKRDLQILKAFLLLIIITIIINLAFTWMVISSYYQLINGYLPSTGEQNVFLIIFGVLGAFYATLYISNYYLYKAKENDIRLALIKKEESLNAIQRFKNTINPILLIESMEAILVMLDSGRNLVDDHLDSLSRVYRYLLSENKNELIPIVQELEMARQLIDVFSNLPYTPTKLIADVEDDFLIIPGTLLFIIEKIIRSTLVLEQKALDVFLTVKNEYLDIHCKLAEKLTYPLDTKEFKFLEDRYKIYSDKAFIIRKDGDECHFLIPKLMLLYEDYHH